MCTAAPACMCFRLTLNYQGFSCGHVGGHIGPCLQPDFAILLQLLRPEVMQQLNQLMQILTAYSALHARILALLHYYNSGCNITLAACGATLVTSLPRGQSPAAETCQC